ncbi:MAG: cupin domain-containing protein [Pseudomonadota bacterium]
MNLSELTFDDIEENGLYTSRRARFSGSIGARELGYNLTELPAGKAQCPFHNHRAEEEMFLILEGEGELRFGEARYSIRAMDVIACPPGGPEVAHQIINTGATTLRYLAVSTLAPVELAEYPDSGKIGVYGQVGKSRGSWRASDRVDYYDGETT